MRSIKFIKDPGSVFDTLFIFTLHFNPEYCLANFVNPRKAKEDTDFYNRLLNTHADIPKELLLFFYIGEKKVNFISKYAYRPCFYPQNGKLDTSFTLRTLLNRLANYEKMTEHIIEFYFPEATEEEKEACKTSLIAADQLIRRSAYGGDLKNSLYFYFISPVAALQSLTCELALKDLQLSQQYDAERQLLLSTEKQLDFDELAQQLMEGKQQQICVTSFENIYISFCLNHRSCVKLSYYDNERLILLGIDYKAILTHLTTREVTPDLGKFGAALSEPNRVDILNFLKQRGEITIKDLEQEFALTGTTAYYHLSLMIKAGLVKTRNRGRTVLYSLNKEHFRALCDLLITYSKE